MFAMKWVEAQDGDWRLVKVNDMWHVERKSVCSWVPSEGLKSFKSALELYKKVSRSAA